MFIYLPEEWNYLNGCRLVSIVRMALLGARQEDIATHQLVGHKPIIECRQTPQTGELHVTSLRIMNRKAFRK